MTEVKIDPEAAASRWLISFTRAVTKLRGGATQFISADLPASSRTKRESEQINNSAT